MKTQLRINTAQEGYPFDSKYCGCILPMNAEFASILGIISYTELHNSVTTTAPHPHLSDKWAIPVNDQNRDMIQAKALLIGCKWNLSKYMEWWNNFSKEYLLIEDETLLQGNQNHLTDHIILTPDQFMRGDVPEVKQDSEEDDHEYELDVPLIPKQTIKGKLILYNQPEPEKFMCVMDSNKIKDCYGLEVTGSKYKLMLSDTLDWTSVASIYDYAETHILILPDDFVKRFPPPQKVRTWKGMEVKRDEKQFWIGEFSYDVEYIKPFFEIMYFLTGLSYTKEELIELKNMIHEMYYNK